MFAVELILDSVEPGDPGVKLDAINSLLGALKRNGNLLIEFLLETESQGWTVYGLAPAKDAFHKANWNEFVHQRIGSLRAVNLKKTTHTILGISPGISLRLPMCQTQWFFSLYHLPALGASIAMYSLQWNGAPLSSSTRDEM